jgi:hypothetical protein
MTVEPPCDYCNQVPQPSTEDYVSEYMVRNRTITVRNITVYRCKCGVMPEYQALGPLLDGITASPDTEQTWARIDNKWVRET